MHIHPTDNKYLKMDLLRFTTAGSVDDGKSTLIGRLLYDSKSIFEDQLEAIELSSRLSGEEGVNLALLTDGLRAEREQKITIDVAYRYFATPRRKFIIADTPGHVQYTRNMVTGASTADLAIILIDARKGVLTQSKRHSFISSLLQIPHMVVAVNKMDLVDYDQKVFEDIVADFREFAYRMDIDDITFIPISALHGDNIVTKSQAMPWYNGPTLLYHLEHVHVDAARNLIDFRFPVQYVIRPHQEFRGFAGRVSSGIVRQGDEVTVLPSRLTTRIRSISTYDGEMEEAKAGDSVVIRIEDEIDISRGDMIVRSNNVPHFSRFFDAYLCWMNAEAMEMGKTYYLMQTTRTIQAVVRKISYQIDVDTMHRAPAQRLELNEIGRVSVETSLPLYLDTYRRNAATGSFILVDPATNVTVGAGMVRKAVQSELNIAPNGLVSHTFRFQEMQTGTDKVVDSDWVPTSITRRERERRYGHKAMVIWLTGISGAGKSTIARNLESTLWKEGKHVVILDGDQLRNGVTSDLGFSAEDRRENIRRVAHMARAFLDNGIIVICAFVSPYRADREMAREIIGPTDFTEVYVHCAPAIAQERDPKGLYEKARKGELSNLTGFDGVYEEPLDPAIRVDTGKLSEEETTLLVRKRLVIG
jgi:bifunctional enzyme CysN/CysC